MGDPDFWSILAGVIQNLRQNILPNHGHSSLWSLLSLHMSFFILSYNLPAMSKYKFK